MRSRLLRSLYFQVLIGVLVGALLGHLAPDAAVKFKPLGDGFIKLIKLLVSPIVFATVVVGIAKMRDLSAVGRVGLKAIFYFEVVTTAALVIGLVVGKVVRPGDGLNVDVSKLDTKAIEGFTAASKKSGWVDFLMDIIPGSLSEAFGEGKILQVLLLAILFGVVLAQLKEKGEKLVHAVDSVGHVLFGIVGLVMRLAPFAAFGAMAFTVGKYGIGTLAGLGRLMGSFYLTSLLFVLFVLGGILKATGLNLFQLLRYLREELLIVLGTSSSESALPRVLTKMEAMGCPGSVVGLVVPMGYSFNLDGTSIYLTLASLFVAQATGTHLTLAQELGLLGVLLLTSKGAAAVTGGGFITLAATLSATGEIPVAGLTLLLGVDRFMSEARALTNLVGNAVATIVVSRWEGTLDLGRAREVLRRHPSTAPAPLTAGTAEETSRPGSA